MPYASWLAAVPLAVFASSLHARASISAPVMRLAAVLLLSQATLEVAFSALPWRSDTAEATGPLTDPQGPCFRSANVRRLAELPPGLVAADLELGPYIVALSPHRVVAAPYHRLEKSILANRAILSGTPAEALRQLQALGVDYVALCANGATNGVHPPLSEQSGLRARLLGGARVDFLRELPWGTDSPIRVWRIAPGQ